jgi:hypothetical protein
MNVVAFLRNLVLFLRETIIFFVFVFGLFFGARFWQFFSFSGRF